MVQSTGRITERSTDLGCDKADESGLILTRKLLAIEVLLEDPEDISDGLESELYVLRDKLQALALS